MNRVDDNELNSVVGGTTLSGTVINGVTTFIRMLYEVGHDFGSAIRRISSGSMCPLK